MVVNTNKKEKMEIEIDRFFEFDTNYNAKQNQLMIYSGNFKDFE